jgi:hypothetical protein
MNRSRPLSPYYLRLYVLFTRVLPVAGLLALSACSTTGEIFSLDEVKPWERGTLAQEDMQLITDAMDQSVDDHIYFSKEGSKGGSGIQGGGCGCN